MEVVKGKKQIALKKRIGCITASGRDQIDPAPLTDSDAIIQDELLLVK